MRSLLSVMVAAALLGGTVFVGRAEAGDKKRGHGREVRYERYAREYYGTTAIIGMTVTTATIATTAIATSSSFATTTVRITVRCRRGCRSTTIAPAICHPDGRRGSGQSRCMSNVNSSLSRMDIIAD